MKRIPSEEFSDPNISPEEAEDLVGAEREAEEDRRRTDLSDIDIEGTGIDSPIVDSAKWGVKIGEEDREDIHWKNIKFSELDPADEDFYAKMVALRKTLDENLNPDEVFWAEVEAFLRDFEDMREMAQDNISRIHFYAMMGNKVMELSYALEKRQRSKSKK